MIRAATSAAAKRVLAGSRHSQLPALSQQSAFFHASARREEEAAKPEEAAPAATTPKKSLFPWLGVPIGMAVAVPALEYEWLVINEEFQLAACFVAFCVIAYNQGGDALYQVIDSRAEAMLKEHREAETKVIEALEEKLEILEGTGDGNMADEFRAINKVREETYAKLNAAGAIKPQHDFKAQIERALTMIQTEENNVAEKAKTALMAEATASVMDQFVQSDDLKKAALDSAIATIKGGAASGGDPVQGAYIKFFQDKAAASAKADDSAEVEAQRRALVAKLNAVAKSEGYFFEFDEAGQPKMVV